MISVKPNAIAASIAIPSMEEIRNDAEASIAEMVHDERADQVETALVDTNGSVRDSGGEDGSSTSKKSNADMEAADAADPSGAVSVNVKYVCDRHKPLNSTICEEGDEADNKCSFEGQSCGGRGKKCHFAECAGEEASEQDG